MVVTSVELGDSTSWGLHDDRLVHRTGRFFSVVSVGVEAENVGGVRSARQPLIDQPEVGLLGFLLRHGGNGTELLVQAKPEPGNVGMVQLAPSVQATRSNYLRVHGGRPTPHLERFLSPGRLELASSLQSEQGSRFLGKYNRNAMIRVRGDEVEATGALRWFSASSVLQALSVDFAVNTDARSVLVSSPWDQLVADRPPFERSGGNDAFRSQLRDSFHGTVEVASSEPLQLLEVSRRELVFDVSVGPLTALPGWVVSEQRIESPNDELSLVHVSVTCSHREVDVWDQPLLASGVEGDVRLLCQQRNGVLQFLFCVTPEVGFTERAQFGPSIQTQGGPALSSPPLAERERIIRNVAQDAERQLTVLQSDEGGRFMHCVGRYSVELIAPDVVVPELRWATWMPLSTVIELLPRQGVFTNEARSALSLLLTEM